MYLNNNKIQQSNKIKKRLSQTLSILNLLQFQNIDFLKRKPDTESRELKKISSDSLLKFVSKAERQKERQRHEANNKKERKKERKKTEQEEKAVETSAQTWSLFLVT